jgi:hypothetical protein
VILIPTNSKEYKMKKFLLATAAVLSMTSVASAMDFGNGLALDTELVTEYNTDTTVFTSVLTPRLAYAPIEGLGIWAETDIAIYNGDHFIKFDSTTFEGAVLGATYVPSVNLGKVSAEAYLENNFDGSFEYIDSVVGVSLSF